jgi:hypothetical protein
MSSDRGLPGMGSADIAFLRIVDTSAEVITALGYTPVNKAGDTMTGNLGINKNTAALTPLGILHLREADGQNTELYFGSHGTGIFTDIIMRQSRGTGASPTATQANDVIGQIGARGYGATAFATSDMAAIKFIAFQNLTDLAQGTHISFYVSANNTAALTERLRVNQAGNIGITSTSRLNLDGVAATGDTYLIESSANTIDLFTGGVQAHRSSLGATTTTETNNVFGRLAALATDAADGFIYIPSGAGTPTGTPTAFAGKVALYYDTTNNKIYIYNGAWKATAALA